MHARRSRVSLVLLVGAVTLAVVALLVWWLGERVAGDARLTDWIPGT